MKSKGESKMLDRSTENQFIFDVQGNKVEKEELLNKGYRECQECGDLYQAKNNELNANHAEFCERHAKEARLKDVAAGLFISDNRGFKNIWDKFRKKK